jgi:hypothetical protein
MPNDQRTKATAKTSMGEGLCRELGGTWQENPDGSGGVCSFGKTAKSITIYRGDPCQDVLVGKDKYILVPHTERIMAALKKAMKSEG